MLIQKGKTNWFFLLIVTVFAITIGGGLIFCINNNQEPTELAQTTELEKSIKTEIFKKEETKTPVVIGQEDANEVVNDKTGAESKPVSSLTEASVAITPALLRAITSAPVEWGAAEKIDYYSDNFSDLIVAGKINNVYVISFTNGVEGVFQEGIDLMAYAKIKAQSKCDGLYGHKLSYDEGICSVAENGIYNLIDKKSIIIKNEKIYGTALSTFFDSDGKKTVAVFSPKGKYLSQYGSFGDFNEGCELFFIDTATGDVIGKVNDSYFGCGPTVSFSKDENTFTVQTYYGSRSMWRDFSVIQDNKRWNMLEKLTGAVNPIKDIKVLLVTDKEVNFNVFDNQYYDKKGLYVFDLATSKLIKK